ncbi:NAD(+) synthase (plasmid) [Alkaliphilus sp. B6464]|nr:NAD(+) synthase [Alkaliphilus sp. B6464]
MQNNNLYTLRNWDKEIEKIVSWIKEVINTAGAKGIILGLSGGLDSAVVAALSKKATDNVLGLIMPCSNGLKDELDACKVSESFNIDTRVVDLKLSWEKTLETIKQSTEVELSSMAISNIKPRLRMTTLYTIGQSLGYLVAGTSNKSEITMGYFTKWGDGASDFNPLANYTKTEIFEMARYLDIPEDIINKPPSANLWEGQTDEDEMGITYKELDEYLMNGTGTEKIIQKIESTYNKTSHKRYMPKIMK